MSIVLCEFKRKLVLCGQNGALGIKLTYPLVSKIVQVIQGQQRIVFPVYKKTNNPSLGEKFHAVNVVLPAFARIRRDNPKERGRNYPPLWQIIFRLALQRKYKSVFFRRRSR